MNRKYQAPAPALRALFVVLPVVATLGSGGFIDTLAAGYSQSVVQAQAPAATQLARRIALATLPH
jgi:hypothetical protein